MQGLHFSTIDLRNKLSKGRIKNKGLIIAQVTGKKQHEYHFTGQGGDLPPCPVMLERNKRVPTQRNESSHKTCLL